MRIILSKNFCQAMLFRKYKVTRIFLLFTYRKENEYEISSHIVKS